MFERIRRIFIEKVNMSTMLDEHTTKHVIKKVVLSFNYFYVYNNNL